MYFNYNITLPRVRVDVSVLKTATQRVEITYQKAHDWSRANGLHAAFPCISRI